jgi:leucine dehydrogenase
MFTHTEYDGHESVLFAHDAATGLRAIVAVHSSLLGPAFGGCRMRPYADDNQALADVLRLSKGMTYKAAICGLPYGGGKSVILGDPRTHKTPELLRAMGRVVQSLGGRYIIADDVGTTLDDLAVMRAATSYTAATTPAARQPLGVTAYGVLMVIEAAAAQVLGSHDLAGVRVAVQGLGNVGLPLCRYLHERGAKLVVTDTDPARAEAAQADLGVRVTAPEAIYEEEVEIFAPCALGAVLNDETIPRLRSRLVCGGANNQLAEARHDAMLAARGITFVPDYLANAGGVIDFYQETIDDRPEAVLTSVERIRGIAADVLAQAAATAGTPLAVADRIVRERLTAAAARYRMA